MDLVSFLHDSKAIDWWQRRTVVCGTGPVYPLLFFACFLEYFRNQAMGPVCILDLAQVPSDIASAQLMTSFLGIRTYYWLKNQDELEAKKRAYWHSFIQKYTGPNCLLLFSGRSLGYGSGQIIEFEIPEYLDISSASPVLNALVPHESKLCSLVIRAVFKRRRKIMLDELCQLARYMRVAGSDLEQFLEHWLDVIIVAESSLFEVSKHLLSRNHKAFFRVWAVIGPQYGELFWVAYWSDIFWRAYHFSRLSSLGLHDQARQFAGRLPFNFIQGGWRTVALDDLKDALNYTYMLDVDIKNGSQGIPLLTLLYLKFLLRQFNQSDRNRSAAVLV
jgi:hypothetical protein